MTRLPNAGEDPVPGLEPVQVETQHRARGAGGRGKGDRPWGGVAARRGRPQGGAAGAGGSRNRCWQKPSTGTKTGAAKNPALGPGGRARGKGGRPRGGAARGGVRTASRHLYSLPRAARKKKWGVFWA